jgi:hypothetical protein
MAAGDAQRVWFPEMIEVLRAEWSQGMAFDALVGLRDRLDELLQQIRSERHIRQPVIRCPECGHVGEAAEAHVTVRAMILSLLRFEIAPPEPTYALEKSWARHRKLHGLDLYGKPAAPAPPQAGGCEHRQRR